MTKESKREKLLREQDEARRAEAAHRTLASHLEQPVPLGCGDSSCVVAAARGMMTNGGCRCSSPSSSAAEHREAMRRVSLPRFGDARAGRRAFKGKGSSGSSSLMALVVAVHVRREARADARSSWRWEHVAVAASTTGVIDARHGRYRPQCSGIASSTSTARSFEPKTNLALARIVSMFEG